MYFGILIGFVLGVVFLIVLIGLGDYLFLLGRRKDYGRRKSAPRKK